ncbi:hypothetical protein EBZ39_15610, partial [bacterium]|nr:hypothetical protein [bacterium]
MANVTITQLPAAGTLTGTELVPIVQNGVTVRTTTGAITSGPSLTQTFLTLNNEPSLANSRYFSVGNGLGLTDNGAQSDLVLSLTGASASLNTAGNGFAVKTSLTTVVNRTLTTANNGLSVTNGSGVSGNPVFSLTGTPLSLANLSGGGFVVALDPSTLTQRIITGTSNQISVANGDGVVTNPTISISNDAVFPGNQGIVVPSGGTAQRAGVPLNGTIRYNTDSLTLEAYSNNNWGSITVGGGVTYINVTGGTTGLTTTGGPVTSVGTIVFGGTLITTNGGTGLSSYTAGDIVYYASGTAFSKLAIGTNGQVLTSTGTAPQWTTLSSVSVTTFSAGTTGFTPNTATGGAVTLSGTLNVANGGTGATNLTGYVKGSGTSAFTASSTIPGADISGNISGNAANVTGTVLVANGGTGANTLTGYVKGSGTSAFTASATIPGTDVSGNISGNAANVTGVVAVGNGGTGATTLTGYVKGSGTSAMTASSTIPNTDVTGLGTMSTQNANSVAITGGAINGTTVGGTTPAAGTFTSVAMTTGTITTTPTNGTDIVNKTYVDSISAGINFHQACRLATATALPSNTYNNGSS